MHAVQIKQPATAKYFPANPGKKLFYSGLIIVYLFFCYELFKIFLQYVPYNTDTAFLRIKQGVIDIPFYKAAFFTHVYTTIFVLPAGIIQFSSFIRRNYPKLHRVNGWIYAIVVILLAGPGGFYMAIYANGGVYSQIAFCILAALWIFFTVMALVKVKQKDYTSHRKYLIRSFALTLSAITLRAWKYIIVLYFDPRPMDTYKIIAWLGWIPNIIIAEYIIRKFYSGRKNDSNQ